LRLARYWRPMKQARGAMRNKEARERREADELREGERKRIRTRE